MPPLPFQSCKYPGCHNLSRDVFCPDHKELAEQERKDSIKGGYSGQAYGYAWTVLSRKIRKHEPVCRECRVRPSRCVDHITPKNKGGKDNIENLQPLCFGCHDIKSRRERFTRLRNKHFHFRQTGSLYPDLTCFQHPNGTK
jgi:5-methylcytosine-specific restriction protein A